MGCNNLGFYRYQQEEKNVPKARRLFDLACQHKIALGCVNLGRLEVQAGNFVSALAAFQRGCTLGNTYSCQFPNQSRLFTLARQQASRDDEPIVRHFEQAAASFPFFLMSFLFLCGLAIVFRVRDKKRIMEKGSAQRIGTKGIPRRRLSDDYTRSGGAKVARGKVILGIYTVLAVCAFFILTKSPPANFLVIIGTGAIAFLVGTLALGVFWLRVIEHRAEKTLSPLPPTPASLDDMVFSYSIETYLVDTEDSSATLGLLIIGMGVLFWFYWGRILTVGPVETVRLISVVIILPLCLFYPAFRQSRKRKYQATAYQGSEAQELRFSPRGIRVGATWWISSNINASIAEGTRSLFIEWSKITAWTVLPVQRTSGYDTCPPRYKLMLASSNRTISILRSPLKKYEVEILDYARQYLTCSVTLRDDIVLIESTTRKTA